jgi:hypothetical protein
MDLKRRHEKHTLLSWSSFKRMLNSCSCRTCSSAFRLTFSSNSLDKSVQTLIHESVPPETKYRSWESTERAQIWNTKRRSSTWYDRLHLSINIHWRPSFFTSVSSVRRLQIWSFVEFHTATKRSVEKFSRDLEPEPLSWVHVWSIAVLTVHPSPHIGVLWYRDTLPVDLWLGIRSVCVCVCVCVCVGGGGYFTGCALVRVIWNSHPFPFCQISVTWVKTWSNLGWTYKNLTLSNHQSQT